MKFASVCICYKKPNMTDILLKCHNSNCKNGQFFHLHCLDYRRMPYNSQTTWMCSNCKVSRTYQPAVQGPSQTSQQTAKTQLLLVLLLIYLHYRQVVKQTFSQQTLTQQTLKVMTPVMMKLK